MRKPTSLRSGPAGGRVNNAWWNERASFFLANEGRTNQQIAAELKTRTARVSKWRQRFCQHRLEGLGDAPRPGKPAKYDETTEKRVLDLLDQPPPKGYSQWN